MARTWLSVTVELLGGRGEELWPYPGRVFAVGPREAEPGRYLYFDSLGSRAGWQDMVIFTERQRDPHLRERLERAIEGRGAFRRFRDVVYNDDIGKQWNVFSRERQMGRARAYLAEQGISVGNPSGGAANQPSL